MATLDNFAIQQRFWAGFCLSLVFFPASPYFATDAMPRLFASSSGWVGTSFLLIVSLPFYSSWLGPIVGQSIFIAGCSTKKNEGAGAHFNPKFRGMRTTCRFLESAHRR